MSGTILKAVFNVEMWVPRTILKSLYVSESICGFLEFHRRVCKECKFVDGSLGLTEESVFDVNSFWVSRTILDNIK